MHLVRVISALSLALVVACGGDDGGGVDLPGNDNVGGVITDGDGAPVADATVTVLDDGTTTTSNADGEFTLEAPTEADVDFLVEAPGFWGEIIRGNISAGDKVGDVEVDLTSDADVADVAGALSRTIMESHGVVVATFVSDGTSLAGARVEILDNNEPVATDPAFTFNASGDPLESDALVGGTEEEELIFTNVPVGAYEVFFPFEGTVGCASEYDTLTKPLPVRAKVISTITLYCGTAE